MLNQRSDDRLKVFKVFVEKGCDPSCVAVEVERVKVRF